MEEIVWRTMLYDFYGELLTAHRREIYEQVVFNDMSLSEAAALYGVSRQGIHDIIRKCDEALRDYESKLQLLNQFSRARELLNGISEEVKALSLSEEERGRLEEQINALKEVIG